MAKKILTPLNLTTELQVNGDAGTGGYVLTSGGPGSPLSWGSAGSGTVSSVSGTSGSVTVINGTTTPTISLTAAYGDSVNPYGTKTTHLVLAGPVSGADAAPSFRALDKTDIPTIEPGQVNGTAIVGSDTPAGDLAGTYSTPTIKSSVQLTGTPTLAASPDSASNDTTIASTAFVVSKAATALTVQTAKTGSYTLALTDANQLVQMNASGTPTLSIPTDATANFPIGTQINVVNIHASGVLTIAAVTPATTTVNGTPGLILRAQWSGATLVKRAANTWWVTGDLKA